MAEKLTVFTRRDLLKGAGLAGAAAAAPLGVLASADAGAADAAPEAAQRAATANAAGGPALETLEALTAAEADTLEAICARLIPTDANGPGAREARAVRYIDRALAGALAGSREAYRAGLAALDRYARQSRGKPFHELATTDQDSVLMDVESNSVTPGIFAGSSGTFFNLVRTHTMQGTFGDPYYGGNVNFVGWDLIGYPGIRSVAVTPEDQRRMERNELAPTHRSAYDNNMYNKATVSAEPHDFTPGRPGHAD
jgi:gluconate 2-dehydrogenase gamma chain